MLKYKILEKDLKSPFRYFQFEVGKEYICEDFDTDKKKKCSRGFYATELEGILYSFNCNLNHRIFECEVSGKKVEIDNYKCRYEKFKLGKEISYRELKKLAKEREKKLDYKLSEILFPINPLKIKNKGYSEKTLKKYLKQWDNIKQSLKYDLPHCVHESILTNVKMDVINNIEDSIHNSISNDIMHRVVGGVLDSIRCYISSFFPNIKKWKQIDYDGSKNPFESIIKLWKSGYIISFDEETYRVYIGEKAEVIYEIKKKDL